MINPADAPAPAALPPQDWHWASTASIDTAAVNQYDYGNVARGLSEQNINRMAFQHGCAVNTATGEVRGNLLRRTKLPCASCSTWIDGAKSGAVPQYVANESAY